MLRRYNLARSDNFPATGTAVVLSDTIVLEEEDLALTFSPLFPSLVTRINLNFSRGSFLSDIDAMAYISGALPYPATLFSELNFGEKNAWILSPQTPLHMLPGDYITLNAKIAESTKSSSSESSSPLKSSQTSISTDSSESSSRGSTKSSSSMSNSSLSSSVEDWYTYTVDEFNEVTITGYSGPNGDLNIPSTLGGYPVVQIGANSFKEKTLGSVTIPEGVTIIGDAAFFDSGVTSFSLPESLTSIGATALSTNAVTELTIPPNVSTIYEQGLAFLSSCTAIHFEGNAPIVLGADVFLDTFANISFCSGATGFTTPDWQGLYCEEIDCGPLSSSSSSFYKTPLTSFTWTASLGVATITGYTGSDDVVWVPSEIGGYPVVRIGDNCFAGLPLTEVVLPEGILEIGNNAFYDTPINNMNLPNSLISIGNNAFESCTGLIEIDIPSNVTSIGDEAFYDCIHFAGIVFHGDAPTIGIDSFGLVSATAYYYYGTEGWGATLGPLTTECIDCAFSTSSQSSSSFGMSSSSISSTGLFRVSYEIHYIPLYQLADNETAGTATLT